MAPREPSVPFLLVAAVLAWLAACSSGKQPDEAGGPPGRGVYVPLSWQTARSSPGHRVHVAQHHVECNRCHELTGTTVSKVTPAKCAVCHEKEATTTHAASQARDRFGPDVKSDCMVCHAFASGGTDHGADSGSHDVTDAGVVHALRTPDCFRCHQKPQGHTPAIQVHAEDKACLSCHKPHRDAAPRPAPCLGCHTKVSAEHAAHGGESGCTGCHSHQHAKASDAVGTCTSCHASREPRVPVATALFASGHKSCEDCHRPHDFAKTLAAPCRSCREAVHVLAESAVPAHRQCTSCHSPHDVRGSARASCGGCHSSLHPDHPKLAGFAGTAGACVGCHEPHPKPGSSHGLSRPCSACHATASSETAFHSSTECQQCHTPHDFVMDDGGKAVCHRCHETKFVATANVAGHRACTGCHAGLPHQPGGGESACPTCHSKVHDKANPGHVACAKCHEPHGGVVKSTCKQCHAKEASSAPSGHLACLKCHDQHSGAPEHAACATCHQKESATKHGQISSECSSCHTPHGPKGPASPPACATCHTPSKLPGLHHVAKHADCKNCHGGHDDPTAALRAPCLTCHADRKNHFPDAPRCPSCHLFQ